MIRFDKQLNQELRRVVGNYNKRAKRLLSKNRQLDLKLVKVSELKSRVYTRDELRFELKQLEMIRGSEHSIEQAAKQRLTRAKRNLTTQIKRLEKQQGTIKYTPQKDVALINLIERRKRLDRLTFKNADFVIINRELYGNWRDELFYENFFDVLFSDAYSANISNEDLVFIQNALEKLTPRQLVKLRCESSIIKDVISYYVSFQKKLYGETELVNMFRSLKSQVVDLVSEYSRY